VAFISLRDNLDLSTPSGRLMFQIIAKDAKAQKLMRSSFQLIDENGAVSRDRVTKLKQFIVKRYLINLPGYGQSFCAAIKRSFKLPSSPWSGMCTGFSDD
jgi:hypothetical protein